MNPQLRQLIEGLRQTHGWDVSGYDPSFLAKSLAKRLAATSLKSVPAYLQRLSADRVEAEALAQSLNITYSEFFRNSLTFALLEQLVLPSLIKAKAAADPAELRVWSAGCAAGQEAWSVAILLEELAVARGRPVPWRIIATDASADALAVARAGVYDRAAVRNLRVRQLRDCFSENGETCAVAPRFRDRVDFSAHDLLDERSASPPVGIYGDFDLILCCNLLFYYRSEIQQRILDKLCRTLSPGGYLVTGEAEREIVAKREELRAVAPPVAVFQKQRSNHERLKNELNHG